MPLSRTSVTGFRILLVTLLLVISYFAFTPLHYPALEVASDKLRHAAAFLALAFALDFSAPARRYDAAKILALLGYGIMIEVVQHFLPFRSSEFLDVVGDSAGLLLYGLALPLLRRAPLLRERWR